MEIGFIRCEFQQQLCIWVSATSVHASESKRPQPGGGAAGRRAPAPDPAERGRGGRRSPGPGGAGPSGCRGRSGAAASGRCRWDPAGRAGRPPPAGRGDRPSPFACTDWVLTGRGSPACAALTRTPQLCGASDARRSVPWVPRPPAGSTRSPARRPQTKARGRRRDGARPRPAGGAVPRSPRAYL